MACRSPSASSSDAEARASIPDVPPPSLEAAVAPMDAGLSPDAAQDADAQTPDIPAAVARAHARFPGKRIAVESWVVLVAADESAPLAKAVDLTRQSLPPLLDASRFGRPPPFAVTAILFSTAEGLSGSLPKGEAKRGLMGGYDPTSHDLWIDTSEGKLSTLDHELAHAIMDGQFRAPLWFHECVATVFEHPIFPPDGGIEGAVHEWRLGAAQRAVRRGARLDAFFGMMNHAFRDLDHGEAVARYVCVWLDARQLLWPFYRAWRDGFEDDRIGARTFTAITGQTPAEANEAWRAWLLGL